MRKSGNRQVFLFLYLFSFFEYIDVSPSGITGASAEADSTASSSTGAGTPPVRSGTPDKDIIAFSMKKGEARRFSLVASVCSTADFSDPWNETVRQIVYIDRVSADEILAGHRADWAGLWESDIVIEGNTASDMEKTYCQRNRPRQTDH